MAEDREAGHTTINAQNSQGFINRPSGPVYQHIGAVINQGMSVAEVVEILRSSGVLTVVTTRLPENAFRELLNIVAEVELKDAGEQLYRACSVTLPPTAHLVNTKVPSVLLANMCEQPLAETWPPLFECIERFAVVEGIPEQLAGKLRQWIEGTASLVAPVVPAKELERLRREISAEATMAANADAFSWLQVYLEPDPLNRTHERKQPLFRVELVLWSPKTGNAPLVLPTTPDTDASPDGAGQWTLDELPSLLDRVFENRETIALIPQIKRLVIEIVAPSDVLLHGFERWKRGKGAETYGTFAPVVVRLRDRLAIPDAAKQKFADEYWRDKWEAFRSRLRDKTCELLPWRDRDHLDTFALQDDADVACLGVSSPLLPGSRDVFDTLRDAGIPIALWMRGSDLGPAVPADWPLKISQQLGTKRLCELREVIQQLRRLKEVRTDASHFCNALTLLWDDPDRPPLKYESEGRFR
jgi:hypothetical protein